MGKNDLEVFADFVNDAIDYIKKQECSLTKEQKEHIRLAKEHDLEPDFDDYEPEGEEPTFRDFYYFFLRTVYIAIYVTEEKKFYEAIFKKENVITPWIFLNISSLLKYMAIITSEYTRELFCLYSEATKDISIQRFISLASGELQPWMENISEYEYYDTLTRLTSKEASILIDLIDSQRTIKNNLKLMLKERNEEGFCELCTTSNLDISKSSGLSRIWYRAMVKPSYYLNYMSNLYSVGNPDLCSYQNMLEEISKDEFQPLDEKILTAITDTKKILNGIDENENDLTRYNFCNLCDLLMQLEGFLIFNSALIELVSTNSDAVCKLKKHIESAPYYNMLSQTLTNDNLFDYNYRCYIPLDNFRSYFVSERSLPEATKKTKNEKEYIQSCKTYDKEKCVSIYKELVAENLLETTDDAFYSFVYRTAIKYVGPSEPSVITWKGSERELFYFVYNFSGNTDTRLWAKTSKFFVLLDGSIPKTNGVKNQAQNSTQRMETLVKRILQ